MPKSPEEMAASMVANLAEKTGKDLDAWLKITRASGLAKHGQILNLLKKEHGVSHGFANLIAHYTLAGDQPVAKDDLLANQYAGAKADLKPIYDRLAKGVAAFGAEVEFSPKKTYVSLRRSKQFGLIQASTRSRVDVGIQLKGKPAGQRLEASGSFNAMVSHRVRLSAVDQVDDELLGWLREAYEAA